jgi:hypothetical protein
VKYFVTITLFLFGFFILFKPPADPDFGWHYKYGEHMFNNFSILRENVFSYTFSDYDWTNSYWLSQIIMYALSHYLGFIGMGLVLSAVMSLFVVWFFQRSNLSRAGKMIGIITVLIIASWFSVTVRPMFFSTILMLTLVYILLYRQNLIKFLPLLFLVWANMHADFILGLFVFGSYTAFKLVPDLIKRKVNRSLLVFSLGSVFVTLINPYGFGLWETLYKETNSFQFSHIMEWLPLSLNASFLKYTAVLAFSGLIAASAFLTRSKEKWWYLFCVLFFFLYSLRSIYFFRPLALVGIFSVAAFWGSNLELVYGFFKPSIKKASRIVFKAYMILAVLVALQPFFLNFGLSTDIKYWSEESKYPYSAVEYIKANPLEKNMFNSYNWGGYLIWQLPEYRTFIDGRMPSWKDGDDFLFRDYTKIRSEPEEHTDLIDKYFDEYGISFVLIEKESRLALYLMEERDWEEVYSDEVSIIVRPPESNSGQF